MQAEVSEVEISENSPKTRHILSPRMRRGLQKPRVGNGTYEDLIAVTSTFEAITKEDADNLYNSIMEERKIRRSFRTL